MLKGIDFSFGNGLTVAEMKKAGVQFVCRYLSTPGNPKNISKAELDNYLAAGIQVIFVFETTGTDMTSISNGISDAKLAQEQLNALGAATAPVFFAADESQEPDLTGYLAGARTVLGHDRLGIYGGLGSVKQAFDSKLVTYGWQTYAWSGGSWDDRALLRQYMNGVKLGPADIDLDEAGYWNSPKVLTTHDDYGQWPRPSVTPPPVLVTVPDVVGKSAVAAVADLKSAGLSNTGVVFSQTPGAGSKVAPGAHIDLGLK